MYISPYSQSYNSGIYQLLSQQYTSTTSPLSQINSIKYQGAYQYLTNAVSEGYAKTNAYVGQLSGLMNDLRNATSELKSLNSNSSYVPMSVKSSNEDAMSVTATNLLSRYTKLDTTVEIKQLATAQQTDTKSLDSTANDFEGDSFAFSITANGSTKDFSVDIAEGDDNKAILNKIAEAINNETGLDITAKVKTSNGKVTLSLKSDETGTEAGFEANLNLGEITDQANNAIYSVNGGEDQTSGSNTVKLNSYVTATFKDVTTEAVSMSQYKDTSKAIGVVEKFVNAYNALLDFAKENSSTGTGALKLVNSLQTAAKANSYSLSPLGITSDAAGRLSIDADKVAASIEDGSLARLFQSSVSGFSGKINTITTAKDYYSDKSTLYAIYMSNAIAGYSNIMYSGGLFDSYQ